METNNSKIDELLQSRINSLETALMEQRAKATAASEILQIVSKAKGNAQPVFETIVEKATTVCNAEQAALGLIDAERAMLHVAAQWGEEKMAYPVGTAWSMEEIVSAHESIKTGKITHIEDCAETDFYKDRDPITVHLVETEGVRTRLIVPMLKDGDVIGLIAVSRREVRPFNDADINVIQNFAAQAVIAIENMRQFEEIETRLLREAASREVLDVISRNQEDEQPVFQSVLRLAATLCGAPMGSLNIVEEDRKKGRLVAHWGDTLRLIEVGKTTWDLEYTDGRELFTEVAMREGLVRHCADLKETEAYRTNAGERRQMVDVEGIRTFLAVPLMRQGVAIGNIALYRREVLPFTPDQIKLVETFAAQAVIAIENVRQFKALETLNDELETRVEAQVSEIERISRLKRFLPAAVADHVISAGADSVLKSHRALLGVLFCDIRGFTAFCEIAEPEETIEVLQTYHEEMGKLINVHSAGVDHRMGDGIMVLFNDPLPCDNPAKAAVQLALDMRSRMAELTKQWKRLGYRLGFGVGVSLGYATVGVVGHEGRFDYTASGTAVNLAARLCDEAENGEILLSPRAAMAVEDELSLEVKGELMLKGIREPVEVLRLSDT